MTQESVLIVEDEQIVALDLQHMLTGLGYKVIGIAAESAEVFRFVAAQTPDIALMDIHLQGPMDGIEIAQQLRANYDIPIIYLTAYSDSATLRRATRAEPFGYIIKPFSEREIDAAMQMALYKHRIECELKESQEWLSTTLRSIGDAVIATDQAGQIKFMNTVAETLTGWNETEAIGKPLMDVFQIINEETRQIPENPVAQVLREGKAVGLANHTILIARDGQEHFIDDSAAPILSTRGTVTGVVLTFRDITERRAAEATLQASQAQLQLAFKQLPALFWTTDKELRYTSSAGKPTHTIANIPNYVPGTSLYESLGTTDPTTPIIAAHLRALAGEVASYELIWLGFTFEGYVEPLRDADNHIIGCIGIALEITERKKAEEKLQQQNDYLAALHDITLGLIQNLDLHDALEAVMTRAIDLVKTPHGFLEILDQAREQTKLEIVAGNFERHIKTWKSATEKSTGVTRQAFVSGQTVVVEDYAARADRTAQYEWLRTSISVPLRLGQEVLGVIGLGFEEVVTIPPATIQRLEQFARFASLALRNAQLYTAAQQEIEERKRVEGVLHRQNEYLAAFHEITLGLIENLDLHSLLNAVMKRATDLVNAPHGFLEILDEARERMILEVAMGYFKRIARPWFPITTEGAVGQALTTRRTIVVENYADFEERQPDMEGIGTVICVPLRLGEQVLGVIGLGFDQPTAIPAETVQQLEQFARFASLAVHNAQLYAAAQQEIEERKRVEEMLYRQNKYLGDLQEIALGLIQNLNQHTLLEAIVTRAAELLHTPHIFLDIRDAARQRMQLEIARGKFAQYVTTWDPSENQGATWQAFVTHKTIVVEDYRTFPNPLPDREWLRTIINLPLQLGEEVLGVIGLGFEEVRPVHAQDIQQLELFAQFASLALHNAQLYAAAQQEIEERKRAEEALRQSEAAERDQRILAESLRDTAAALSGALDLDSVLASILDNVGRVVPHDSANIMLRDGDVFRVAYSRNVTPEVQAFYQTFRYPLLDLMIYKTMLESRKPVLVSDTKSTPGWISFPLTAWVRSYIGFPINVHGDLIGMLNLDSATPNFFTQTHAEQLEAFANQVAIAVENAQMYERVQRHAAELEQHVAERTVELSEKQAQLEGILEAMNEGVAYIDFNAGEGRYLNSAFTSLTGLPPEDVIGQPMSAWVDIFVHQRKPRTLMAEVSHTLLQGKVWQGEITIHRRDEEQFLAEVTGLGIKGPDGGIKGAVVLIRDISQEKALQDQKDQFIANAAHELRTPITNLHMRLYLARKQPDKIQEHVAILESTVKRLKSLVENLLDISRFEHGIITLKRRYVILQDLIEQVVAEQRLHIGQKELQLESELPALPLFAEIDPDRIEQVVTNLVSNAINYTPSGGRVQVQLLTKVTDQKRYAVIQVHDTGIGISSDALPHLFEPFYRAAPEMTKGTGLGLTLCKDIMDLHSGRIDVESQVGTGSTFSVWLPLEDAPRNHKAE